MSTIKGYEVGQKTHQNYYISDQRLVSELPRRAILGQYCKILINGVPVHIINQMNSDTSNLDVQIPPIYETIESDYYSEMSSVYSERGEVGSTTYQQLTEENLGEVSIKDSYHNSPQSVNVIQKHNLESIARSPRNHRYPTIDGTFGNGTQPSASRYRYLQSFHDSSLRPDNSSQHYHQQYLTTDQSNEFTMADSQVILQTFHDNSATTQL